VQRNPEREAKLRLILTRYRHACARIASKADASTADRIAEYAAVQRDALSHIYTEMGKRRSGAT
jgi:hypothetical protein